MKIPPTEDECFYQTRHDFYQKTSSFKKQKKTKKILRMTLHKMIHDRFNQECGCEGCESLIHKGEHWYCCCCTTTQFSRFPAGSAVVSHRRGEEQADFEFRIQVGPSSHGRLFRDRPCEPERSRIQSPGVSGGFFCEN